MLNHLVSLFFAVVIVSNFLACVWIQVGFLNKHAESGSWVIRNENGLPSFDEDPFGYYVFSVYHVWTILSTVGYGSFSYNTVAEMWFVCAVEVVSFGITASTVFIVANIVNGLDNSFEQKVRENLDAAYEWVFRLQKTDTEMDFPRHLAAQAVLLLEDSMRFDFNLIIEEFPFYQQLPPRMQTQLVESFFGDFLGLFDSFFSECEQGFRNELIVNMYMRSYFEDQEIFPYGRKLNCLYFICKGTFNLLSKELAHFMQLPTTFVVGDCQLLFDTNTKFSALACPLIFDAKTEDNC